MNGNILSVYLPANLPHDEGLVVVIMACAIVAGFAIHLFRRRRK